MARPARMTRVLKSINVLRLLARHCEGPRGRIRAARSQWRLDSLGPQDHAIARRASHCDESVLGIFERIDRLRVDRKRLQISAGKSGRELAQHSAGCTRRQSKRIDTDIGVLAAIEFQDVEL